MAKQKKKSKFLGKVNSDAKRQKTAGSSYGYLNLPKGVDVFSVDPGSKVKLDFIPYIVTNPNHPDKNEDAEIATVGEQWYKRPFKIHRNVGVEKEAVVCLTSFGKKCPICDYWNRRRKEGADKEELDAMKPSARNLYCIVPKGNKKIEAKPHIWDISQFLFQNLLNDELEENEDNGVFPDLEQGKTLSIRFESKTMGGGNPFANATRIDFEDRDEAYDESILDEVPDLDKLLSEMTFKQMETKFFGMEGEIPDEEDEDDMPKKKKSADVKSSKKVKPVVEEEEEEEEEEDEDDSPPVRKKKVAAPEKPSKKKPIVEDEDDEEDAEEEEDEEEAPPVRKKKAAVPEKSSKKKPVPVEEEDEDDAEEDEEEDEDEDEDEEEEAPVRKKPLAQSRQNVGSDKKRAKADVADPILCVACQGSGKNSRGKTCPICDGTGIKPDKDAFYNGIGEDDEDEVIIPRQRKLKPLPARESAKKDRCPHGHKFGIDTDKYDECSECNLIDDCMDEKEG